MGRIHFRFGVIAVFAGMILAGSLSAQTTGSQAVNIPFTAEWQVPAGVNELDDYFVSPGYVTLLELWSPT